MWIFLHFFILAKIWWKIETKLFLWIKIFTKMMKGVKDICGELIHININWIRIFFYWLQFFGSRNSSLFLKKKMRNKGRTEMLGRIKTGKIWKLLLYNKTHATLNNNLIQTSLVWDDCKYNCLVSIKSNKRLCLGSSRSKFTCEKNFKK